MKFLFAVLFCIFMSGTCFYKMCNRHFDCDHLNDAFLCCLCSAPECTANEDCGSGTACYDGKCTGIKKFFKSKNINMTALNEYNEGYICKSDVDCEDGAFCFNGDCSPSFMKKEHQRFKRSEAFLPGDANQIKGYRCKCHCIQAEQYPPECKKILPHCQRNDDCRSDNSMCVNNLCTKIWPEMHGDNEEVSYSTHQK